MAGTFQDEVFVVARAAGPDIEAFVAFLVNQHVLALWLSHGVAEELELPLGSLIFNRVEKRSAAGRPDDGAHPLRLVAQHFPRSQVLDVQGVLPETRGIGRIGKKVAVIGDGEGSKSEEAGGYLVHIQNDLFARLQRAALAAVDGILGALLRPR